MVLQGESRLVGGLFSLNRLGDIEESPHSCAVGPPKYCTDMLPKYTENDAVATVKEQSLALQLREDGNPLRSLQCHGAQG